MAITDTNALIIIAPITHFLSFLSRTSQSPTLKVNTTEKETDKLRIHELPISVIIEDKSTAVTQYLAISINHLPSSFLILQTYEKKNASTL